MSRRPFMPLYVGDYIADTSHLTTEQHGAYLLLLMHYWRTGGPLPDDDAQLALVVRASVKRFRAMRIVLTGFFRIDGGKWHHDRVEKELANTDKVSKNRAKAAQKRWSGDDANADAGAMHLDMQMHMQVDSKCNAYHSHNTDTVSSLRSETDAASASDGFELPAKQDAARERLFGKGREWLIDRSGLPDRKVRTLLGRWLKEAGDDASALLELLRQCREVAPVEPVAWMSAAVSQQFAGPRKMKSILDSLKFSEPN